MESGTIREAAAKIGIHRKTLARWLKNSVFSAQLDAMRSELAAGTIRRLLRVRTRALEIIDNALTPAPNEAPVLTPAERVELAVKVIKPMAADWVTQRQAETHAESDRDRVDRAVKSRLRWREAKQHDRIHNRQERERQKRKAAAPLKGTADGGAKPERY
jgi:hypothetical protein